MRLAQILLAMIALVVALPSAYGQGGADTSAGKTAQGDTKDKTNENKTVTYPSTPLRVQVTIDEFNGTEKISSLPYSLNVLNHSAARLRLGVKVPVTSGQSGFTYQDVGTDIDIASVNQREDGTYEVDLTVDRSSVSIPMKGTDWKPGDTNPSTQPLIRSFRDDFRVVVKPAQTVEGTSAVDPVTGHVLKVEVTLSIPK